MKFNQFIFLDFSKIYTKLLNYVMNLRLKKYIEKNLVYIRDYSSDFNNNLITELIEKDNVKLRIKPQEMLKLYDNLLEYENQLINLEKENPDQSYLIDLNFRNKFYSVFKIYYSGLFHLLNKKFENVYTLMHHVLERVKELNEFYDLHNLSSISSLRGLKQECENLEDKVRFVISKAFVKMNKEKNNQNNLKIAVDLETQHQNFTQNAKKEKAKVKFQGWLNEEITNKKEDISKENFELLKENMKVSYEEVQEAIEKTNYNNYSHVIQIPPNTKLLEPKPIIYDLAFLRFQYPNLENKKIKEEKGIFGRAFGYFFKK